MSSLQRKIDCTTEAEKKKGGTMRALILSVTAGQGHNMCAKALEEAFALRDVESQTLDTLAYISRFTGNVVDKGYLSIGKNIPKVWGAIYNNAVKISERKSGMRNYEITAMKLFSAKLLEFLHTYKPQMIVCTHVFASQIVTAFKQKNELTIPVYGINTDFTLHPFWEEVDMDYLVLACDKMYYSVVERGIPTEKLLPFGIPVRQCFNRVISAQEGRKEIGYDEKLTISIMGGSMGFGHLFDDVIKLDQLALDFQIVVVCGNNKGLYDQLTQYQEQGQFQKTVHIYGFTDQMDAIMRASDVICTKPGGLSTSEALSLCRPIVLLDPIPGLEENNAWFLANNGVAVHTGKSYPLPEAVYNLFCDTRRIADIIRVQKETFPRNSANNFVDFVINRELKL